MTESPSKDAAFAREALPEMDAVYRFALRLAGDRDRADDLVQDTFLRAWRSWDAYTSGTKIRSWLFTICRNVFLRSEERARRHTEVVRREAEPDPGQVALEAGVFRTTREHDPEGAFWNEVVDDEILAAIERLPVEFREAFVLVDMEGLPYAEIGQVLSVPVGTVKSRVFRARRHLQQDLHAYAVSVGIMPPPARGPQETQAIREREAR